MDLHDSYGDGTAGLVCPPDVAYGSNVLLGTLHYTGPCSWVFLSHAPGDLTEGFALPGVGQFADVQYFVTPPKPATGLLLALGGLALRFRR